MPRRKQAYQDGEVIYREGDPADGAYEVLSGSVELFRPDADINQTENLQVGQMFGEMGLVGGGIRDSTARAVGSVQVRLINGDAGTHKSEMSNQDRGVFGRVMDQMGDAIGPNQPSTKLFSSVDGLGFIQRMAELVNPLAGRIMVRVAQFSGDHSGTITKKVIFELGKYRDVNVRPIGQPLDINFSNDLATEFVRAAELGRSWLRERQADILIWGHVSPPGTIMHIRFISLIPWDERVPGGFDLTTDLPLPSKLDGLFGDLLHAATLSATVPVSSDKAKTRLSALLAASNSIESVMDNIPRDMTQRERAALNLCYGNILSSVWSVIRTPEILVKAVSTYRNITTIAEDEEPSIDWAMAHKHLSSLIYLRAESEKDLAGYEESAASALSALELFSKDETPYEWAALQHRLGLIHYTLGYEAGHTGTLKQALRCHQNALKIYSKRRTPARWAEVMSSFARAAQAFGEQVKSLEAIATAVNAYVAVLKVRDVKKGPLAWAATQNNLGSALFSLGKKASNPARIEGAIQAFEAALELYELRDRNYEASISRKNLDRAQKLMENMGSGRPSSGEVIELDATVSEDLDPNLVAVPETEKDFNNGSTIH